MGEAAHSHTLPCAVQHVTLCAPCCVHDAMQARIMSAGGFVTPPCEEYGATARVWTSKDLQEPGLAMARSIGDNVVKR